MTDPLPNNLNQALLLPSGARFHLCALQINPYAYLLRHGIKPTVTDEVSYNSAIVRACMDAGVEVIGVADHYRISSSASLIQAATAAGLKVFPGFEAVTKDGVHFLILFDPDTEISVVQAKIHDCGVHDESEVSPAGKYDSSELLDECRRWGAVCIAAHATGNGGLLTTLSGQARARAWRHPELLACSLAGPISAVSATYARILQNTDASHRRLRPIALLNVGDVSDPGDLGRPNTTSFIKMSSVRAEGLRQALLDPSSRIRLSSDPEPEDHSVCVALSWQGGFLDGCLLHLNENLNVLIGGRGAGKSTVIESLRYVLDQEPVTDDARKGRDGIVASVLKNGTKISLLVQSHRPDKRAYVIERTVPNPPRVRHINGNVLPLKPRDILPHLELFGQHEIAEVARTPERLTTFLGRFLEPDVELTRETDEIRRSLQRSRQLIGDVRQQLSEIEERLAALPALINTLDRYREAGLEARLRTQSQLISEEQILRTASEQVELVRGLATEIRRRATIDTSFLGEESLGELPNSELLRPLRDVLANVRGAANDAAATIESAVATANEAISRIRTAWQERKNVVDQEYERVLRELQATTVDAEQYLRLRRQYEELQPIALRRAELTAEQTRLLGERSNLVASWEDVTRRLFNRLEHTANRLNSHLLNRVRVSVTYAGSREPLFSLLRSEVGGRLTETLDSLKVASSLSPIELADACRAGRDVLVQKYGLPSAQAIRLAEAAPDLSMKLEELDLPATTLVELNIAGEGQQQNWRALDDLSTGQRATAVLLLLLVQSDAPLIVDQPEDDLDNRFITEGIVPKLREEKRRRQFILATHNANIPVLGDAELIMTLTAAGSAGQGKATVSSDHMGSIDSSTVRGAVEDILEGGKEAFEMRRLKYGF